MKVQIKTEFVFNNYFTSTDGIDVGIAQTSLKIKMPKKLNSQRKISSDTDSIPSTF